MLRAQNIPFEEIANKLDVSKRTLIEWSKDLKTEIANYKAIEKEKLYKQYLLSTETKIKAFGELLTRIKEEISSRDLQDVETNKLIEMMIKISNVLDTEREELRLIVNEDYGDDILKLTQTEIKL